MRLGLSPSLNRLRRGPTTVASLAVAAMVGALAVPLTTSAAGAATTTVTVLDHDFENGQTHGWYANGITAVNATRTDAHGGSGVLAVSNKTGWGALQQDLRSVVQPGVTYTLTGHVRLATGAGNVTMTLNAGSDYQNSGSWEVPVNDTTWTTITRTYTVPEGSDLPNPLQVYFEMQNFTDYYLDDFTMTHETTTPPEEEEEEPDDGSVTLLTSTYEDGTTEGWGPRGDVQVVNSAEAAHSGTRSLAVTGRTQNWQGPVIDLLGRVQPGVTYTVTAWVRAAAGVGSARARLSMEQRLNDTPRYDWVAPTTTVTDSAWTKLTGTYTLASDVDLLALYAETDGTESFFVDDVRISYVPAPPVQTDIPSLKDEFSSYWPRTGAAVAAAQITGDRSVLLKKHFNSVTPENALKWDAVHPQPDSWNWTDADTIVDYAQSNDLGVYGHTLAWHSQLPAWVFQDSTGQDLPVTADSKKIVLDRLAEHIRTVVGRYKGRVYAWDVANEVIDDAAAVTYRQSKYHQYTGLDYIRTAFTVAHEVDPEAQLCINDYNTTDPTKRQKYYGLVKQLLAEDVPIDCVGHQMHSNINYPSAGDMDATLSLFENLGVRQRITELDVSVYANDTDSFDPIPAANVQAQEARYKALFETFLAHEKGIDSVTTWGLADDHTWLSSFPIQRLNTPLLFDNRLQAKPVFTTLVDLARSWTAPANPPQQRISPSLVKLPVLGTSPVEVTLSGGWCLDTASQPQVVALNSAASDATARVTAALTKTSTGEYVAQLPLAARNQAGWYEVYVQGTTCTGTALTAPSSASLVGVFRALNPTMVLMDAAPETAHKGRAVTINGLLARLASGRIQGWAGQTVLVEFRPENGSTYQLVRTVTTGGTYGAFTVQVTPTETGTWRVRYAGDPNHAPSSMTDSIRVK